jgi:hypothetical protein
MPMAIDAGPLKGLAVFASDSIGQAYVTNRGGRVQSAIAVGTDFVLVPNKWERTMAPEDVQLAKDLHIPIGDGAELLRMADRQAKK